MITRLPSSPIANWLRAIAFHQHDSARAGGERESFRSTPCGFSSLDLMVALAIIATLATLLLSAVNLARRRAEVVGCANNLRQIGAALGQFETVHRRLPGAYQGVVNLPGEYVGLWDASPLAAIAPFLEAESEDPSRFNGPMPGRSASAQVPAPKVAHCPSDANSTDSAANYRYCRGAIPIWPGKADGTFVGFRGTPLSQITDGLAATAFASERPVPSDRDVSTLDAGFRIVKLSMQNESLVRCAEANRASVVNQFSPPASDLPGTHWQSGDWTHSVYYHAFPPNSDWFDCYCIPEKSVGVWTARSLHGEGVNVLFGDGRIELVSNHIARDVWHAMATIAGGD